MRSQFYVPVDGWLNRVDVRVKLFTMIAVIVMCSIWGNWVFLTAMLLAEHLFLLSTRIPARKTLKVWSFFLPVIVIVFCIMLLTVHLPGWTLWRWGSWLVTSGTMDLCGGGAPYRRYRVRRVHRVVHHFACRLDQWSGGTGIAIHGRGRRDGCDPVAADLCGHRA